MIPRTNITPYHQPNYISSLPNELQVEILSYLPAPSIVAYSMTHHSARDMAQAHYPVETSFYKRAMELKRSLQQRIQELDPSDSNNKYKFKLLDGVNNAFVLAKNKEMYEEVETFSRYTNIDDLIDQKNYWYFYNGIHSTREAHEQKQLSFERYVSYIAHYIKNGDEINALFSSDKYYFFTNLKKTPNDQLFDYAFKGDVFRKLNNEKMILTAKVFEANNGIGDDVDTIKALNASFVHDAHYNGDRDADYAALSEKYGSSSPE